MNLNEYSALDAIALGGLVSSGEISPEELATMARTAAEALNPDLNAIIEHWEPEVADLDTARYGTSPLAGVPFLIKDIAIQMAGRRVEMGSRLAAGQTNVQADSNLMRHFRRAGLVTLGRTTTPELAFSTETESVLHGSTRNPWNLRASAGGSSGGAGAAVAAGIVPIAHATDAAGSIRVPAACNGLVGLKPTRGRTSNGPSLDEVFGGMGVQLGLSRTVRDTAALMDAVQGYSSGDPYYTPPPEDTFLAQMEKPPGRLRVGLVLHPWNGTRCVDGVSRATHDVALHLESLGHHVEEVSLELGVSWDAFVHANAQIWCSTLVRWVDGIAAATGRDIGPDTLEPSTLAAYRYGLDCRGADFAAALEVRNSVARSVGSWFESLDIVMSPTLPELPGAVGAYKTGTEHMDGLEWTERVFRHSPFTPPANVAGTPAISLPLAVDVASAMPIGVQFAAAFAREGSLLRLAAQLEKSMPWAMRRPPVWAGNVGA